MIFPAWFETILQVAFLAAAFCSVAAAAALALKRRRMNRLKFTLIRNGTPPSTTIGLTYFPELRGMRKV